MSAPTLRARIAKAGVVAIVRLNDANAATAAAQALILGGVSVIEFSLTSREAITAIEHMRDSNGHVAVGAGTVLTMEHAKAAVDAGAEFLISPGFDCDILAWASDRDILYVPGVLTPTEVHRATKSGAEMLKLFPAAPMGAAYVRQLLGPFPNLSLIATGGIDEENMWAFLEAGASAVAIGSALVNPVTAAAPAALSECARGLQTLANAHAQKEDAPCP